MAAPALAWIRWSQCTVEGTATSGEARGHELEERHLRGGVLHGHPVGVEVVVGAAPLDVLAGVPQVVDEHLLGEGEAAGRGGRVRGDTLRKAAVDLGTSSMGVVAVTSLPGVDMVEPLASSFV